MGDIVLGRRNSKSFCYIFLLTPSVDRGGSVGRWTNISITTQTTDYTNKYCSIWTTWIHSNLTLGCRQSIVKSIQQIVQLQIEIKFLIRTKPSHQSGMYNRELQQTNIIEIPSYLSITRAELECVLSFNLKIQVPPLRVSQIRIPASAINENVCPRNRRSVVSVHRKQVSLLNEKMNA